MSEATPAESLDRLEHAERFLCGWDKYKQYCIKPVERFDIYSFYCFYTASGYTACAAGAMALHPWFIERGFTADGLHNTRTPYEYCAQFFGIDQYDAVSCFCPASYYLLKEVTPAMVAARIRAITLKMKAIARS